MEIHEQHHGAITVFGVVGRLDSVTCRDLETRLIPALGDGSASVIVDCAGLDYVSSAGLRVLLLAAKRSRAAKGRLALTALKKPVRQVFDMSGFSAIFAIHPTTDDALAAFG